VSAFPGSTFELVASSGGLFEVDVDGQRVFSKARLDRFPEYQEVPKLVLALEP